MSYLATLHLDKENFKDQLHITKKECIELKKNNQELKDSIKKAKRLKVVATAYTASKAECDSTPNRTAIMRKPIPGRTVAVSRDLKHLLGKKVYLKDFGVRIIEDLMAPSKKQAIDILFAKRSTALDFGKKDMTLIIID